jgi:hypothetical protein
MVEWRWCSIAYGETSMQTNFMKIQHGIRASFLQNSLIVGRKIVRFTATVCRCSNLNLAKLVEQPFGGR